MAITVSLPGANNTGVTATYTGVANSQLALSIANELAAFMSGRLLSVDSIAGGGSPPAPSGLSELEVTSPGVVDGSGYAYVVDNSGGDLSINGGVNFVGQDGNISFTNDSNATSSVLAGNGNDTFNLSGTYSVAAGSGADQFNLSGSGEVSLGGGVNAIQIAAGSDTIFAAADGSATLINGGGGSTFFYAGNTAAPNLDAVYGGTGGSTLVGGSNSVLYYASPAAGPAPPALLVAGAGNETLFGAPSHGNDALWGSFVGGNNDLMFAGTGNDALVGGSGNDTLVGGSGTDAFYVINANITSALTGTQVTPGQDFIYNAHPGDYFALTGYDTLYGGAVGSGAAASAVRTALASSNTITLKDGTTVTFVGGSNGITITSS
jgi:Ca2+-binding RTX toxin-like protein